MAPSGGVCIVSCFHNKCDDMKKSADSFGHDYCVCYDRGDDMQFGICRRISPQCDEDCKENLTMFAAEYVLSVMKIAQEASQCIAIVGDRGEEGATQRELEFPILDKEAIKYAKMSLQDYVSRFERGGWMEPRSLLTSKPRKRVGRDRDEEIQRLERKLTGLRNEKSLRCGPPGYISSSSYWSLSLKHVLVPWR